MRSVPLRYLEKGLLWIFEPICRLGYLFWCLNKNETSSANLVLNKICTWMGSNFRLSPILKGLSGVSPLPSIIRPLRQPGLKQVVRWGIRFANEPEFYNFLNLIFWNIFSDSYHWLSFEYTHVASLKLGKIGKSKCKLSLQKRKKYKFFYCHTPCEIPAEHLFVCNTNLESVFVSSKCTN